MKNMPLAARLNQRIELLENVVAGDLNEAWRAKFSSYAAVKTLFPNNVKFFEGVDFGNLINESYSLFTVRFSNDITKDMRIRFKQKEFLIKKIINVAEKNRVLEIIAMEVA